MAIRILTKVWWIDNAVPIVIGALIGATVAGGAVHALVQDCNVFGFRFDPQTWVSATLGVVLGGILSWIMAWAYAKKAEDDVRTILGELQKVRASAKQGAGTSTTTDLILDVLASNPTIAKGAAAALVKVYGLLADTAALKVEEKPPKN